MSRSIPIEVNPQHTLEVDGALVARGLELAVGEFQTLMERRQITVLSERGTEEDEGLYRASFYHEGRRVRLVLDRDGMPLSVDVRAPERP